LGHFLAKHAGQTLGRHRALNFTQPTQPKQPKQPRLLDIDLTRLDHIFAKGHVFAKGHIFAKGSAAQSNRWL
jgi:hypothetical protein